MAFSNERQKVAAERNWLLRKIKGIEGQLKMITLDSRISGPEIYHMNKALDAVESATTFFKEETLEQTAAVKDPVE